MEDNDNKYRSLFEIAPIGISIVDLDRNIIEANQALLNITGISFQNLKAGDHKKRKYIHPDGTLFLTEEFPSYIALKENRVVKNVEIGIITEEGKTVWTEVSASPLINDEKRAIVITQDITERKILQKELIKSEERLRLASIATGFGTYSYEFSTGKAFYSDEFLYLYGLSAGETIEMDSDMVAKAIHPDDKPIFLVAMQNANDPHGSGILDLEFRIILPDGEIRWLRTRGLIVFNKSGETWLPLHANGILQNITERKNAVNQIRDIDAKYHLIFENSGLGIGYYDTAGNILIFNEEALKNLGGTASDYIGKNLTDVFGQEAGDTFIKRLNLVAKSETPVKYEEYIALSGRPGWYLSTHTRILDQNGNVDGIQVISENITKRKLAEKKLIESQRKHVKLARHLEVVRENERLQIAMNLHDDLGQKLTALKLDMAWIKSRIGVQSTAVNKKMTELNQNIVESIDCIKELAYSLRPSILFDLGLIPAIDWQLKKFSSQSGIGFNFFHEPDEAKIEDNLALIIFRVIQESLTNIVRHSEASFVEVSLYLIKNRVEFSIKDNGIGISYIKVRSLASMGIVGIKDRVSSVGGKISIRGKKDSGTIIKVTIPIKIQKNHAQSTHHR